MKNLFRKLREGFTLIEILIVVAILSMCPVVVSPPNNKSISAQAIKWTTPRNLKRPWDCRRSPLDWLRVQHKQTRSSQAVAPTGSL